MLSRSLPGLALLSLGLLFASGSARAQVVPYSGSDTGAGSTDPRPNSTAAAASFAAAAGPGNLTTLTFESSPLGSFSSLTPAPGVTITGTDYLGANQTVRNSPDGTPDSIYGYNTTPGGTQFVYEHGGTLIFTFASPVDAFGAYISGIQYTGETITFNDGSSQTVPIPGLPINDGGVAFVGFTDAGKSISQITINATGTGGADFLGVDDVSFRLTAAPVPEPGTMALLAGLGVSSLLAVRRARRRSR